MSNFAVIISIGGTKYYLRQTPEYKVVQSLFTLLESQSDTAWDIITSKHPEAREAGSSINVCEISPASRDIAPWPHRIELMTKVVEAELNPRFERMIEGELV